jgi:hypothetical protein
MWEKMMGSIGGGVELLSCIAFKEFRIRLI